jgi:Tol biopolymer transport system component
MRRVHLTLWLAALWACGDTPNEPAAGSLEITTVTTGDRVDPDGYVVALDGAGHPIGSNATLTLADVSPGDHEIELHGLAAECALAGPNPRPITLEGGASEAITLKVSCLASAGSIALRTRTSGASPDLDGYTVALDGGAGEPIDMNAVTMFSDLPVGDHTLVLSGVAANCTVQGENPRTVLVTSGARADVTFEVACRATSPGILLLTSDRTGKDHVYRMAPDGSGLVDLSRAEARDGDWSPDRSRIVFESTRFLAGGIYVMAGDGTQPVRLAAGGSPAWSPDGSTIAFASDDSVAVMNADGTGLRVLAAGSEPAWSPDGRRIVFTRTDCLADICGGDLYLMAADGSGVRRLTNSSPFDGASAPAWSPDGTRIAYARRCCFLVGEGSGLATIAPEGGLSHVLHTGAIVGRPVWAPDGSAIAFAEDTGAGLDAMIMPAAGGAAEVLVGGPADDRPSSWK